MEFDVWQKLTLIGVLASFVVIAINPVAGGIFFCFILVAGALINNRERA